MRVYMRLCVSSLVFLLVILEDEKLFRYLELWILIRVR